MNEKRAATVMETFREQYPEGIISYLTVETEALQIKTAAQGKPWQCSALVPALAGSVTLLRTAVFRHHSTPRMEPGR